MKILCIGTIRKPNILKLLENENISLDINLSLNELNKESLSKDIFDELQLKKFKNTQNEKYLKWMKKYF